MSAFGFVLDLPGMTVDQLNAAAEQLGINAPGGRSPEGQLAHIELVTDDGVRVVDVWESEEAYGRFMEQLGPIMGSLGIEPFDPPPALRPLRVLTPSGVVEP